MIEKNISFLLITTWICSTPKSEIRNNHWDAGSRSTVHQYWENTCFYTGWSTINYYFQYFKTIFLSFFLLLMSIIKSHIFYIFLTPKALQLDHNEFVLPSMASKPLKLKILPKRRAKYHCVVSYHLVAAKDSTEGMLG